MGTVPLELDFVEALVRERCGIPTRAARLTGDRDENFRLQAGEGPGYVLKVLPPAESAAAADLLPAVLTHLERVAVDLPVPRVVPTLEGHSQVTFKDAGGQVRIATLCTYLPGKLLMSTTRSSGQRRACGELLARLGVALRTFDHVAARRAVAWDIAQVPKLARVIPQVPGLPHRDVLQDFVNRFSVEIAPRLARLRHQFVHNDFNARNILVDPDDESRVVGIIDFGDAVHTALAADVAVGVTGQLATPETAEDSIREFVEAYCAVEPLRQEELALLNWLIAGRTVLNAVLTAWRRAGESPGGHFEAFDAAYFGWRIELAQRLVSQSNSPIESAYVKSCFIHK
jgi:Ser/Thr protein kinase RdoA (MazF antagonist)